MWPIKMSKCWVGTLSGIPEEDIVCHIFSAYLVLTCSWWEVSVHPDSFLPISSTCLPLPFSPPGGWKTLPLVQHSASGWIGSPASSLLSGAILRHAPYSLLEVLNRRESQLLTAVAHSLTSPVLMMFLPYFCSKSWATSELATWLKSFPQALPLGVYLPQAKDLKQHIAHGTLLTLLSQLEDGHSHAEWVASTTVSM